MKTIINTMIVTTMLLSFNWSIAQTKKTETVKIYGNCGMCEKIIEKAGTLKNVVKVDWNKETKMATITYDAKKTNQDEILKRIALAGYDSDKFLAPDDVYNNLHGCCQYDREAKNTIVKTKSEVAETKPMDHAKHQKMENKAEQDSNLLKVVFDNYFTLKDALVKSDGTTAANNSKFLLDALNSVNMKELPMDVHVVWMKSVKELKEDAEHIADTKDIGHQRDHFITLSENIYELIKTAKYQTPVFYQFCPMANSSKGANWLSTDSAVKNPYYGSKMLSCGKTVETIK